MNLLRPRSFAERMRSRNRRAMNDHRERISSGATAGAARSTAGEVKLRQEENGL